MVGAMTEAAPLPLDEQKVAAERDRCVEIVKSYLSPYSGILLQRRPDIVLEAIIYKIEKGGRP